MGRKAKVSQKGDGMGCWREGVLQSKQRLLETGAINDHIPGGVAERLHGYMELAMLGSADRFGRLFGWAGLGRCKAQREEFAAKSLTRLDLKSKLQGPPLKLGPDQLLWGTGTHGPGVGTASFDAPSSKFLLSLFLFNTAQQTTRCLHPRRRGRLEILSLGSLGLGGRLKLSSCISCPGITTC